MKTRDSQITDPIREKIQAETLWVTPVRLRCARRVLWLREVWARQQEASEPGTTGLHQEIDRLLSDSAEIAAEEAAFYARNREAQTLECAIGEADLRVNRTEAWQQIREEYGLSVPEQQFLLLTIAAEIQPGLRRVFGYLSDESQPHWPSPALAAELFGWPAIVRTGADSRLIRGKLACPADAANGNVLHSAEWQPDAGLVAYLLHQTEENQSAAGNFLLPSAGPAAFLTAYRSRSGPEDSELFAPLPCPYNWNDLVLPPPVRAHLEEFAAQVGLRSAVYDAWGMGRLTPVGRGISALFAGPSGTGKTMAAQVLARTLGLDLLRIDLAEVMNKYIGETEKRLKRVFAACENRNALLFFDEADALFGQRTQVKDAHDRFANIEIDYLLQRIEQFDGVAILATNRKSDLDKAFLRRLRFLIEFVPPGMDERLTLWQHVLPEFAPNGERIRGEIDWQFLAQKLDMTGADIKNTALSAAFLARSEGKIIVMRHLLAAARREMSKHGLVLRPSEWDA